MNYQQIDVVTERFVRTITLSRPDKLNAWTQVMDEEVRHAVTSAENDPAVRVVIITGAGRGFCAGADMNLIGSIADGGADKKRMQSIEPAGGTLESNYGRKFGYLLRFPKPIIAAINGPVAGIGLCLTLFCDFRYMAQGAKLTTAFARRGLIAEHGSSWLLPRLIGTMNALDLLCSARTVMAEEAAAMGLVRTLPADNFLAAVQDFAARLAVESSPRSMGVMKRQVYDSFFQSLDEATYRADVEMAASFDSEDFKEGVAHYMEKRAPAFTGK
jgi:enoyl-CoA hydratase/carnithine racemase